jgi:hypothetical protein
MEKKRPKNAASEGGRKDRLKAALKANMQKRKAQARARQKGQDTEAK